MACYSFGCCWATSLAMRHSVVHAAIDKDCQWRVAALVAIGLPPWPCGIAYSMLQLIRIASGVLQLWLLLGYLLGHAV